MYIQTPNYSICMYMYVYKGFFISSFLQGTTRKSEDIRGSPFLKFTRKKVFKLMQNAFRVIRSRTPVSTVKGDDLCHYASMAVMPTSSFDVYNPVENIYVHIRIYMHIRTHSLLYVHIHAYRIIHTYTCIYIHILKLTWARIYIHTCTYVYIKAPPCAARRQAPVGAEASAVAGRRGENGFPRKSQQCRSRPHARRGCRQLLRR
jgi:hypothetical protein